MLSGRLVRKDAKLTAIGKVRPTPATNATMARADHSGDGLANAIICIAVMLSCVLAVIFLIAR